MYVNKVQSVSQFINSSLDPSINQSLSE